LKILNMSIRKLGLGIYVKVLLITAGSLTNELRRLCKEHLLYASCIVVKILPSKSDKILWLEELTLSYTKEDG